MTPEVSDIVQIAIAAYEAGADGLTLINTMPALHVDIKGRNVSLRGGLSGPLLKPIALKAVKDCSEKVPIPIIGVGGIMDWEDCIAFFMAGAKAVQVGTATFVEPYAIPKIIEGLRNFIDENHYSIDEIIGTVHHR